MATTTALLDAEQAYPMTWQDVPTLCLNRQTATGTLRLAPAPPRTRMPENPTITALHVSPPLAVGRPRHRLYVSPRCCDVAVALLILLIAAVALYPLIWIGQP